MQRGSSFGAVDIFDLCLKQFLCQIFRGFVSWWWKEKALGQEEEKDAYIRTVVVSDGVDQESSARSSVAFECGFTNQQSGIE